MCDRSNPGNADSYIKMNTCILSTVKTGEDIWLYLWKFPIKLKWGCNEIFVIQFNKFNTNVQVPFL